MEVDAPIAIRTDAFTDLFTVLSDFADTLVSIEHFSDARVSSSHAKRPVSSLHCRSRSLFQTEPGGRCTGRCAGRTSSTSGVTFAVIANRTAEQFVNRQAQSLTLDIP